jgi:hypothetical protein
MFVAGGAAIAVGFVVYRLATRNTNKMMKVDAG